MYQTSLFFLTLLSCSFAWNLSLAQVPNICLLPPATKLESFETNVSTVIIKATTELGTITVNTGVVLVKCREITDTASGHKEQGIAIDLSQKGQGRNKLLIDYDEIASLSNAISYLNKLDVSITPLNAFDAEYTTKGGFRIAALGNRRTGAVQFAVRDVRINIAPIIFSRQELLQFGNLVTQAKSQLDSLRGG
jgi:hypothetical protein